MLLSAFTGMFDMVIVHQAYCYLHLLHHKLAARDALVCNPALQRDAVLL
jgi:hypothetical protein